MKHYLDLKYNYYQLFFYHFLLKMVFNGQFSTFLMKWMNKVFNHPLIIVSIRMTASNCIAAIPSWIAPTPVPRVLTRVRPSHRSKRRSFRTNSKSTYHGFIYFSNRLLQLIKLGGENFVLCWFRQNNSFLIQKDK